MIFVDNMMRLHPWINASLEPPVEITRPIPPNAHLILLDGRFYLRYHQVFAKWVFSATLRLKTPSIPDKKFHVLHQKPNFATASS